jgi:hypothetical protein
MNDIEGVEKTRGERKEEIGTRGERILWEKEVETRSMIMKEGRRKNREKGRRRWNERRTAVCGELASHLKERVMAL